MATTMNRAYSLPGMMQAMPLRITTPQWQMLQEVELAAKAYGWHTHRLPGEYGVVRVVCERGQQILKASALPPRLLREGGKPAVQRLFYHLGEYGEPLQLVQPAAAARALSTPTEGTPDENEI